MRAVSVGTMIVQLSALRGTTGLSPWENEFIASVLEQSGGGARTSHLSSKQVSTVESIWRRHYA